MTKLSEPQIEVLRHMAGTKLVRLAGGTWTYEGCPRTKRGMPHWSTQPQMVRSLENLGLIERCGESNDSWRDSMRLTDEGRETIKQKE